MKIRYSFLVTIFVVTVNAEYDVPVSKVSAWHDDGDRWFYNGVCEFEVTQTYPRWNILVNLVLNQPTYDIQIWTMDVIGVSGSIYELGNKHIQHPGKLQISFIVKYTGSANSFPVGFCQSNLPSSPDIAIPTTTIATNVQSNSICSTTNTGITSSIEKMQDPWPVRSNWNFKGRCRFNVQGNWNIGSIRVDMCFDQPTRKLQVWTMNVINRENRGRKYSLSNKYNHNNNQELEIQFIVRYSGSSTSYPTGSCYSNLPIPQTTSSTTITTTGTPSQPSSTTTTPSSATTSPPSPSTTTTSTRASTPEPTTATSTTTTSAPSPSTTTTSTRASTPEPKTTTSTSNPPNTAHDYGLVLEKSILFYEAQRSGDLPADNRIDWRGDSAVGDSGINGEDLSGGWYDAGDHVKFNLPMSEAVTTLAIGLYKWKDAYQSSNQLNYMYDSIRWPLDYFLKCWQSSSSIYYAQVGNGKADHDYWGRPEEMKMARPAYYLQNGDAGGDVTGGTAGALAAGALAFTGEDQAYAQTLLSNAESLYAFAKTVPRTYGSSLSDSNQFYPSSEYRDEMCLSAALLYMATQNDKYKNEAIQFYNSYNPGTRWAFDWDDKSALCQVLLYDITKDATYKTTVESFVTSYMPGGNVPYTPCGLAFRLQWAPNRYAANAAFIALLAADLGIGDPATYKTWAMSQLHYMLGDNKLHLSYVLGYGNNFPKNPHHRSSTCNYPPATCDWNTYWNVFPNAHVLQGALIGGPDQNDGFPDNRDNHQTNEVALDYNAGFQSAIAGLLHFANANNLPTSPTPSC